MTSINAIRESVDIRFDKLQVRADALKWFANCATASANGNGQD